MVFLDYKTVAFSGNGTKYVTEYKSLIVAEFSNISFSIPSTSGTIKFSFTRSGREQDFHKYVKSSSFSALSGSTTNYIYENFSASHVIPAGVSIAASGYTTLTGIFHIYRLPE
jgi:hypothetical protein